MVKKVSRVYINILVALTIVSWIAIITMMVRIDRLENPKEPIYVTSSSLPDLPTYLGQNNVKLDCSNYSQKEVLTYNLSCRFLMKDSRFEGVVFELRNVNSKSCGYIGNEYVGEILNYTVNVGYKDDECLEYKIVPLLENKYEESMNWNIYIS